MKTIETLDISSRKKIGVVIQGDDVFGIATVTKRIAAGLPGLIFIAYSDGPEAEAIRASGNEVHLLSAGANFQTLVPVHGFWNAIRQQLSARKKFVRCAEELEQLSSRLGLEVLHGHVLPHHFSFASWPRSKARPVCIWHLHNCLNQTRQLGISAHFNWRQARRGADHLLCVSAAVARGWERSKVPITIVHNGTKIDVPYRCTYENKTPLRAVTCGRMDPLKGHHVAIEAIQVLRAQGIIVQLDIWGGPLTGNEYAQQLKGTIDNLGLQDAVRLRGFDPRFSDSLPQYDIAIHNRIDPEPCSMYVLECMAAGMPLVATDNGGTPELARDGIDALLYKGGDAAMLATRLARLTGDSRLRSQLGASARSRLSEEFSESAFIQKLEAFYARILQQRRS